jgi:Tol biopolymer transport system component
MQPTSLLTILAVLALGVIALDGRSADVEAGSLAHVGMRATMIPSDGADTLSARRLRTVGVWPWDVSPDGRHVSIIDWPSGGNLAVIDLITGEERAITQDGAMDGGGRAGAGRFSPDGSRIAYPWIQQDCGKGVASRQTMEIRVVATRAGAEPITVLPCREDIAHYSPWDWTPDGTGLLVVFRLPDGMRRMATVNVADGSIHEIVTFARAHRFEEPRYSPDGRYVVYGARSSGADDIDLHAVSTDGGAEVAVVQLPGSDRLFGWSASGTALYVYNVDGLRSGLYRVPIANGRPAGDPELVRRDLWRAVPLGATSAGFAYVVTVEQTQVQIASVDIEHGRLLTPFGPVEDPALGTSRGGAWSPDGRYLAYVRRPSGETARLFVRSTDGTETREYPWRLDSGGNSGNAVAWAPDGDKLIVHGSRDGLVGLFEIDLQSGDARPLVVEPGTDLGTDWRAHALGPDGRIAVLANTGPERDEIRVHDLIDGDSRIIARVAGVNATAVSPDGQTLAFTNDGRVSTVPIGGGEVGELFRDADLWGLGLQWTPDGRYLVWVDEGAVWRMPTGGGDPTRIVELPRVFVGYPNLRLQPGGSGISYTGGQWRGEVWLLENEDGG